MKKTYHPLYTANYNGIDGVKREQGQNRGTTVGIGSCTHGGEITGLQVIDEISSLIKNKHITLTSGEIFFLLNNREAYKKFIDSRNEQESHEELLQKVIDARYIEENLNRCYTKDNLRSGDSSEARRAQELLPILKQCNYFMDIHSTYGKGNPSMLISSNKSKRLSNVFNMDQQLYGIPEVQVGRPLISTVEDFNGTGIGMETGYELDASGKRVGTENILRLLRHLHMIRIEDPCVYQEYNLKKKDKKNKEYHIYDKIVVDDIAGFSPNKQFMHGDVIFAGDTIATQGDQEIVADQHSQAVLPLPPNVYFEGQEYMYLAELNGPAMYSSLEKMSKGISTIFTQYLPKKIDGDIKNAIEYSIRETVTQSIKMIEPQAHTGDIFKHLKTQIYNSLTGKKLLRDYDLAGYMTTLKGQNKNIQMQIKNFFHRNNEKMFVPNIIND